MEGYPGKDEGCPKLLDLIPQERQWVVKMEQDTGHGACSEEQKLELRLGPPGGPESSNLSRGCFSNSTSAGTKRGFTDTTANGNQAHVLLKPCPWSSSSANFQGKGQQLLQQQTKATPFLQLQSTSTQRPLPAEVMSKDSSQHCCSTKAVDLQNTAEKKAFSPPSAAAAATTTAVPNSSTNAQKRTAPAAVVGWPPIRSFRKIIASGSHLKSTSGSQNGISGKTANEKAVEICQKGLFVKINMDGVPIGRKVDLKAYDTYEKLSSAVDELFRGLLAAQGDSSAGGIQNKGEGEKVISGLLDGSGEYTLVYEDNEGDRMLVGDVPWHMFVSTVKRLRVLKSSEIATLCRGSKQGKLSLDVSLK
ncbi:auxin-responsive protein IAA26-like [Coffea arabica]|uniref:Auxin-responsive protein n=1 Tax=Coffea arabica TaxID=13443 RepID=A0A6P6XFA1_COFAR|nr:auxin-responsive protein IAA26-like [Coffea arabica]XP_027125592.1 auxin-responsive protein IAA26-like [Coffea arabica]